MTVYLQGNYVKRAAHAGACGCFFFASGRKAHEQEQIRSNIRQ